MTTVLDPATGPGFDPAADPERTGRKGASQAVRGHISGMPRQFWYLWWGQLVNKTGGVVQPFLSIYLTVHLSKSVSQAGLFLTLLGIGGLASQLIGGVLSDRYGRRFVLIGGMVAASISLMALGFARSDLTLALFCLAVGVTNDLYRPASSAALADIIPPSQRVRAYGLMFWAINLGFAIATILGGAIASHTYQGLFVFDSLTCLAYGVILWRGFPETQSSTARALSRQASGRFDFLIAFRDRQMAILIGLIIASSTVYMQAYLTLPIVMTRHGLGPQVYGAVAAVNGVLIVLLQPVVVTRTAHLPRISILVTSEILMGFGFGATRLCGSSAWGYAASVAIWTVGEVIQAGLFVAIVSDLAPPHLRGRYMGAFGFSFGVAAAVAPLLGSQVLDHGGQTALWLGCLNVSLLVAGGLALLEPRLRARGAAGPART